MDDGVAAAVVDVPEGMIALVSQLRQEVGELRQEVKRLCGENLALRQQAGYWQQMHTRAVGRIKQLEQRVHDVEGENRQLRQQAFGRKTEKRTAGDDSSWLNELE